MSIEAMKLALEALELHGQQYPHMVKGYCLDAITALRQAIEQAQQAEPVMWCMPDGKTVDKWGLRFYGGQVGKPLYTAQPQHQWVGLTDEEIEACHDEIRAQLMNTYNHKDIYRVLEAKLKEKNT